jgi:hypothetical protein
MGPRKCGEIRGGGQLVMDRHSFLPDHATGVSLPPQPMNAGTGATPPVSDSRGDWSE